MNNKRNINDELHKVYLSYIIAFAIGAVENEDICIKSYYLRYQAAITINMMVHV